MLNIKAFFYKLLHIKLVITEIRFTLSVIELKKVVLQEFELYNRYTVRIGFDEPILDSNFEF